MIHRAGIRALIAFGLTVLPLAPDIHAHADDDALLADDAFAAVRRFADNMLEHGRDKYGEKESPLFVAQLNVQTQRIPEGTDSDPGVWNGHLEVAGYQPFCQNLLQDLGLLDVLRALSIVTGDAKYDTARREYLEYVLREGRDPRSGYIPWGEHVGYDIVRDRIHVGDVKYWHEVKAYNIPWDQLWEVDPEATRHEIETAFYNHICDEETFAFNRHATMDGKPNLGSGATSLLSSAGVYLDAWCWLYKKTGEEKFLDWAKKINALVANRRSPETGLIPTDEDTRTGAMVYAEAAAYTPYLFVAAELLGTEGEAFRADALGYLAAYNRYAFVGRRDDNGKPGYFDALDTGSGQPIDKGGGRYLEGWIWLDNHEHVGVILSAAAIAYGHTGDEPFRAMADRAIEALDIPGAVASGNLLLSCDVGGAIASLVMLFTSSGESQYLDAATPMIDYALKRNYSNGYFTSGMEGKNDYYCTRTGSGYLASAVLSYALARHGRADLIPPVRDFQGGLRF